ncbi:hypothetical protein NUSPORA_01755 [Nucleospora cyclopteri]
MIKKFMLLLRLTLCMDLYNPLNTFKAKVFSIVSEYTFLDSFGPKFFDYNTNYTSEDIMIHLKNIIFKSINEDLIYIDFDKEHFNEHSLKSKISEISNSVDQILKPLNKPTTLTGLHVKLEIMMFRSFYKILEIILVFQNDNNLKKIIYESIIFELSDILKNIKYIKKVFSKSVILNSDNYAHKIEFLCAIRTFLTDEKNIIYTKLLIKQVLHKQCNKFIANHKPKEYFEKNFVTQNNQKKLVESKIICSLRNIADLENIITQEFNFSSCNIIQEIEIKIYQIYSLIAIINSSSSFELNMDHLVMIIFYYEYLIQKIYLKIKYIDNTLFERPNICYQEKLKYLEEILRILRIQKHLYFLFFENTYIEYSKEIKNQQICNRFKTKQHFLFLLITLDKLYKDLVIKISLNQKDTKEYKEISIKIVSLSKKIENYTSYIYSFCKVTGLQLSFDIFIIRLCSIFTFFTKSYKLKIEKIAINLINFKINQLNNILKCLKNKNENMHKIEFIEVILKKNKDNLSLIINKNTEYQQNIHKNDLYLYIQEEWKFEIYLFEKMYEMFRGFNPSSDKIIMINKNSLFMNGSQKLLKRAADVLLLDSKQNNSELSKRSDTLKTSQYLSQNVNDNTLYHKKPFSNEKIYYTHINNIENNVNKKSLFNPEDINNFTNTSQIYNNEDNSDTNNLMAFCITEGTDDFINEKNISFLNTLEIKCSKANNQFDKSLHLDHQDLKLIPFDFTTSSNNEPLLETLIDTYLNDDTSKRRKLE